MITTCNNMKNRIPKQELNLSFVTVDDLAHGCNDVPRLHVIEQLQGKDREQFVTPNLRQFLAIGV